MPAAEAQFNEVVLLLVDDDDVDAMGIRRALDRLRIANPYVRARDGIEALEMLRDGRVKRPYLILLDINMPRMNGIEMLEALRDDPELANSVVFVLTTSQDDQERMAAYRNNIAGYIVKGRTADGFIEVVTMLDHYWKVVDLPVSS
jgi:CheY-like chemotaxis protein